MELVAKIVGGILMGAGLTLILVVTSQILIQTGETHPPRVYLLVPWSMVTSASALAVFVLFR